VCSNGEIKQAILIGGVEFFEAGLENEMVEKLVHGQDTSSVVDKGFHLQKTELVEAICPYIHGVFVGD
jgi:hypothetical protein